MANAPKPGQKRQPINNRTMQDIMKQKTKGQDWSTARKKLITEALQRKPTFIKEPKCKTCGKK